MKRKTGYWRRKTLSTALILALTLTGMPLQAFAAEVSPEEEAVVSVTSDAEETVTFDAEDEAEVSVSFDESEAEESALFLEGEEETPTTPTEGGSSEATSLGTIEINQGLSIHTGLNDGNETYMDTFVARKKTAVMAKIPGSDEFTEEQAKSAMANYKLEAKAVTNGQEADNCELTASGDSFKAVQIYDKDCDVVKGWYAIAIFSTGPDKGTYNFHLKDGDKEIAEHKNVTFYETTKLNILVVPVNGYWSASYTGGAPKAGPASCKEGKFTDAYGNEKEWSELCGVLKEYLLDVYPIADVNFEEGQELKADDANYDMVSSDGQKKLWEEACKLQTKTKDGKDRYDLILAFVQYRQDQGGGQGYTFGKPTNIITYSDKDMLPTVAHEIAHCYQVGDEYDGGSFNPNVNFPPNGYKGRDFVSGNDIASSSGANAYWQSPRDYRNDPSVSGDKKARVDVNGAGTMVKLSLHPYSLSQERFIRWAGVDESGKATGNTVYPTISYMGSGYSDGTDGYYFTTSVIWDHLLKQLVTKTKKDESAQQEQAEESASSNADVFANAMASGTGIDEYSVFSDMDDLYYDDDCRWGDSRMVEVYGWLVRDPRTGKVTVGKMSPMFSYNGDLETIEVLDEAYKNSEDVYTFVALDANGKVLRSPVDHAFAAAEFYGGFFNPRTKNGKMQTEINFSFDAEYPEGTADFAIFKGKLSDQGTYEPSSVVWQASTDENFAADFAAQPEGYLTYADVNATEATVMWEVYGSDQAEEPYDGKDKSLYTEVYYCPEGDDGEAYYVGCSEDEDWQEGAISFETDGQFDSKWTRNAYVWIKVTNGVNAVDIYSDENEITLCNSTITLSGAGIRKDPQDGSYYAECTGYAIEPAAAVKAYDPETGKYIGLKKDTDYTVTYENNVEVGYATVSVQGIGLYAGKNVAEFEIRQKQLAATPDTIPDLLYTADLDAAILPYLRLKDAQNEQLVFDRDFTVTYKTAAGEGKKLADLVKDPAARVTVTVSYVGKGNFKGINKKTTKFDILPASTANAIQMTESNTTVELKTTMMRYTGKALKPAIKSVTVKDSEGNETKLRSSDYKVVYSGNVAVGTGRVTVVGKKNCTGSSFATFEIAPKEVTAVSVSGLKNQYYTGSKVDVASLPLVVKAGGITLRKGVDYTVEEAEGCDYTNVTTKEISREKKNPKVVIKLVELTEEETAAKKSAERPRVVWSSKVKADKKVVTKAFSITQTKLNSAAVTVSPRKNTEAENVIRAADGTAVATMRSATRDELKANKKAYAFVISGKEDTLSNTVNVAEALSIKAYGKDLTSDGYTVTVSKTKAGKVGKITYAAVKGAGYSGSRTIKFLYQLAPQEEETEEAGE